MARKFLAMMRLEKEFFTAYALGAFFNILVFPVYLAVYYFLWSYVYASASSGMPMEFNALLFYYGTVFFVNRLVPDRGFAGSLARAILKGRVNSRLVRPIGLQRQLIYSQISHSIIGAVILLPTLVAAFWFFGRGLPVDVFSFVLLLIPAFIISFLVYSVLWEIAFWTEHIRGTTGAFQYIIRLFSGSLIPLSFFPGWFKSVSGFLPFEFMAGLPARALLGEIGFQHALVLFGIGMAWAGLLYLLTRFMLSRGLKRYSGYGV